MSVNRAEEKSVSSTKKLVSECTCLLRVMLRNGLSGKQASQIRKAKSHVVTEIENRKAIITRLFLSPVHSGNIKQSSA